MSIRTVAEFLQWKFTFYGLNNGDYIRYFFMSFWPIFEAIKSFEFNRGWNKISTK